MLSEYISVKLADEAGEVVMLEVQGQKKLREVTGIEHQEAVVPLPPPDQQIRPRVAYHLIRLRHESMQAKKNKQRPKRQRMDNWEPSQPQGESGRLLILILRSELRTRRGHGIHCACVVTLFISGRVSCGLTVVWCVFFSDVYWRASNIILVAMAWVSCGSSLNSDLDQSSETVDFLFLLSI